MTNDIQPASDTDGAEPHLVVGVDIGGTFTDAVIMDNAGIRGIGKAFTEIGSLENSLMNAVAAAADACGLSPADVWPQVATLVHGTTVGTNALVERSGARVGLICTAGHRDVLAMMRAAGRVAGQPVDRLLDVAGARKPAPLVQRSAIVEIAERTTAGGDVLMAVDADEVADAAQRLRDQGCDALAVSLLWSTASAANEMAVADALGNGNGSPAVSLSHRIAPRVGEYERTVATVVNAYVSPPLSAYLGDLNADLAEVDFDGQLWVMTCAGGMMRPEAALERALATIGSGPAGGVLGCEWLARELDDDRVIATDMGGTTFDASLLVDGKAVRRDTSLADQYEYFVETIDVQSVGAGGGSIGRIDETSQTLKVGPESAGSLPGPICFGRGGEQPTITDADLVLGYIDPARGSGQLESLDRDAAERALADLGSPLGMSAAEAAAGMCRIADERMADLIRRMTLQRGHDPRRFRVYAFGGAGPMHVGAYARSLGVSQAVVPIGAASSVWSAFGAAVADARHVRLQSTLLRQPIDEPALRAEIDRLRAEIDAELAADGFAEDARSFEVVLEARYSAQVHRLEIPIDDPDDDPDAWEESFERRFGQVYEERYGAGTAYRDAGLEIAGLKVSGIGGRTTSLSPIDDADSPQRSDGQRLMYFYELGRWVDSPVVALDAVRVGDAIDGPAVIEIPMSSIVVRPDQVASLDPFGNVVIDL